MPQVTAQSPKSSAYDQILDAIRSGAVQPGDRLREEEIAARLSLSRTPVREALRRLEADGIVVHRPRQGAMVRQLGHSEVVELYEMRVVLERTAAEMAAKHGTPAEFDTLHSLNSQIAAETANSAQAAAINQAFHQRLYLAGRNRFLVDAARALNNPLMLLGPTTFTDPGRVETVVGQHGAIIDALRAGDAEAAGQAATDHLECSLRVRLEALTL